MPKPSNQRKIDFSKLAETFSIVLTIAAFIITIVAYFSGAGSIQDLLSGVKSPNGGVASKAQIDSINVDIASIKQEQANLDAQIKNLSQPNSQTALNAEVDNLKTSTSNIDERLTKIESLIIQDPQKALEIPLMRKDLDNITTTTDLQIANLRQDVERNNNLVLVTIGALAIAILAPALSNLFKNNQGKKE